MFWQRSLECG
jgi:hypothetical protein